MIKIDLKNKTALVTSVSDELGMMICFTLAKAGAEVWVHQFRENEEVRRLKEEMNSFEGSIHFITSDLANPNEVKKSISEIIERSGKIDILINQSENPTSYSFEELSVDEWVRTFQHNLDVPFLCCKEVLPSMVQNGNGLIINISSHAAITGEIGAHYAASKSALDSFTKGLAREFKDQSIKVKSISPAAQIFNQSSPEKQELMKSAANMIMLLCSPYTDCINGETITVSNEVSVR